MKSFQKVRSTISKIFRLVVFTLIVFIAALTSWLIYEPIHQPVAVLDHLSQVVKVDKRINDIAAYQRARYSKIAKEIAELQAKIIVKVADEEEIPVELLVGLAEKESFFNSQLTSVADAGGLTQILVEAHITIDEKQKYDIEYNLRTGCRIFKQKLKAADGNYEKALDFYSGHAHDYAVSVFERVGRFVVFSKKMDFIRNELALQ